MTKPHLEASEKFKAAEQLTAAEQRMREDAVRFADASMSLEGFVVSAQAAARAADFVAGRIDLKEFVRYPVVNGPAVSTE